MDTAQEDARRAHCNTCGRYGLREETRKKNGRGSRGEEVLALRGKGREKRDRLSWLEVITEIDGHRSNPSCSLCTCIAAAVYSLVWHPPVPAPRDGVIDLLDTRYMGYRYGCYRRSS